MLEKPTIQELQQMESLDIQGIMAILPHRYPFLLLDRVTDHVPNKSVKGYKNVSINEPFFQGHFPGLPIMPGVLIVEALAQLGCILVAHMAAGQNKLTLFAGIDDVRFRRQVVPGDKLELYTELLKLKGPIGKAYVKATVDGELACDGQIMFSMLPKPTQE